MQLLLFVLVGYISVCVAMDVKNRSYWEVRQYINSLGVVAPYAATAGELPYLVVILDERVVMCNGVIVTYEFVMASSLCMQPEFYINNIENIPQINILAGVSDTTDPNPDEFLWSRAKDLICDSPTNPNLVLIHLLNGLNMTGFISGIALPVAPFTNKENCFVAGYVFKTNNVPIYQRKQAVDIYNSEKCSQLFEIKNSSVLNGSICLVTNNTVLNEQNETLAWDCEPDDGSIAFCERTLIGFITKPLEYNCTNNTPFLYLDVGMFYNFFEKQMLTDDNQQFIGTMERSFGSKKSRFRSFEENGSIIFRYPSNWLCVFFITCCFKV